MRCVIFFCTILLSSCIIKNRPTTPKFIPFFNLRKVDTLSKRIHKQQWRISYRYGEACAVEEKQNSDKLEALISETLRAWIEPLRELNLPRPLADSFVYRRTDIGIGAEAPKDHGEDDLYVLFTCEDGLSSALVRFLSGPLVTIRRGTALTSRLKHDLTHELGHAFGLGDVYLIGWNKNIGGLKATAGKQPASIMSGHFRTDPPQPYVSEDDRRGMVWLYRHIHEGKDTKDCFFPDYVYEASPNPGCRPKHILIFEVKQRRSDLALQMMDEDPTIDINEQDDGGFTALHYAVMSEQEKVVEKLLAHKDIKPFLRDKQGRSALQLAREAKLARMIALLLQHPMTLAVEAKGKKITTWGELKKE